MIFLMCAREKLGKRIYIQCLCSCCEECADGSVRSKRFQGISLCSNICICIFPFKNRHKTTNCVNETEVFQHQTSNISVPTRNYAKQLLLRLPSELISAVHNLIMMFTLNYLLGQRRCACSATLANRFLISQLEKLLSKLMHAVLAPIIKTHPPLALFCCWREK